MALLNEHVGRLEDLIAARAKVEMRNDPSSIGLRHGTVELRMSDSAWAEAFRSEAARLAQLIAGAELAPHIHTTAEHIQTARLPLSYT